MEGEWKTEVLAGCEAVAQSQADRAIEVDPDQRARDAALVAREAAGIR